MKSEGNIGGIYKFEFKKFIVVFIGFNSSNTSDYPNIKEIKKCPITKCWSSNRISMLFTKVSRLFEEELKLLPQGF